MRIEQIDLQEGDWIVYEGQPYRWHGPSNDRSAFIADSLITMKRRWLSRKDEISAAYRPTYEIKEMRPGVYPATAPMMWLEALHPREEEKAEEETVTPTRIALEWKRRAEAAEKEREQIRIEHENLQIRYNDRMEQIIKVQEAVNGK